MPIKLKNRNRTLQRLRQLVQAFQELGKANKTNQEEAERLINNINQNFEEYDTEDANDPAIIDLKKSLVTFEENIKNLEEVKNKLREITKREKNQEAHMLTREELRKKVTEKM